VADFFLAIRAVSAITVSVSLVSKAHLRIVQHKEGSYMTDSDVYGYRWDEDTSSTLLGEVKAASPIAWNKFVGLYHRLVYRWCRQAGLQPADAADVGQEVFRAVARKIGDYRHDRSGDTFRGWLRTITRNKIRDWGRQRPPAVTGFHERGRVARRSELPIWDLPDPDRRTDAEEARQVYLRACEIVRERFETRTWQAFWQATIEEIDVEDVAANLQMSVNAVRLAKSRVLKRLRQEFAGLLDFESP
jgi:RNA polymerase sigma-70 factor (ECF subfamily)